MKEMVRSLSGVTSSAARSTLTDLCFSLAVDVIRGDALFFATSGLLSADALNLVEPTFSTLVKKIAPSALALVDAFAIPEHLLSPAAGDWVAFNKL